MNKTLPIKPKSLNVSRTKVRFSYYGSVEHVVILAKVYRPYLGDGLPRKAVWCRQGQNVFFRCPSCSMINRNSTKTFGKRTNFAKGAKKKFKTTNLAVLHRCISCRWCRRSVSGTVLLGFKDPEAFLKKKASS